MGDPPRVKVFLLHRWSFVKYPLRPLTGKVLIDVKPTSAKRSNRCGAGAGVYLPLDHLSCWDAVDVARRLGCWGAVVFIFIQRDGVNRQFPIHGNLDLAGWTRCLLHPSTKSPEGPGNAPSCRTRRFLWTSNVHVGSFSHMSCHVHPSWVWVVRSFRRPSSDQHPVTTSARPSIPMPITSPC